MPGATYLNSANGPGWRRWAVLALLIALTLGIGALGSLSTAPKIAGWYAGLDKPFFTPPGFVFGPVWSALYVLMAIAAWRVWQAPATPGERRAAAAWFGLQLLLNGLWPHAFFGLESPGAGLAILIALLVALAFTMRAFWSIDRPAALLLAPYAAWSAFALALNGAIVVLN